MSQEYVESQKMKISNYNTMISMATSALTTRSVGSCRANISLNAASHQQRLYPQVFFRISILTVDQLLPSPDDIQQMIVCFIQQEVDKLLKDGIIQRSSSPWRAQVLVTANEKHKKRLVIDYSPTIDTFTYSNAYPLPRIDDLINKIAKFKVLAHSI